MSIAYQHDASGYFAGELEDHGLLPNNATYMIPPVAQDGFIQRWNGTAWVMIENHKGKEGYVNGKSYTITDYGPLPAGWSDTPPPPTEEELRQQRIVRIKSALTELDAKSARAQRAMLLDMRNGVEPNRADETTLAACEAEALDLRAELAALEGSNAQA